MRVPGVVNWYAVHELVLIASSERSDAGIADRRENQGATAVAMASALGRSKLITARTVWPVRRRSVAAVGVVRAWRVAEDSSGVAVWKRFCIARPQVWKKLFASSGVSQTDSITSA